MSAFTDFDLDQVQNIKATDDAVSFDYLGFKVEATRYLSGWSVRLLVTIEKDGFKTKWHDSDVTDQDITFWRRLDRRTRRDWDAIEASRLEFASLLKKSGE